MEWKSRLMEEASNLSSHVGIRCFSSSNPLSLLHFLSVSSPKTLAPISNRDPLSLRLSSCRFPHVPISSATSPAHTNPNPSPNYRVRGNSTPSSPLSFRHFFQPFLNRFGLLSSSFSSEALAFERNHCPKLLRSTSSLERPIVASSRNPSSKVCIVNKCANFTRNLLHCLGFSVRWFSTTSTSSMPPGGQRPNANPHLSKGKRRTSFASHVPVVNSDQLAEIVELIERGEADMERKLNKMHPTLSVAFVCKILGNLNDCGVSALQFFDWVQKTQPDFIPSSEIYNLIIDNLGRLEDYESMFVLLSRLSQKRHCLTEKAFEFLTAFSSDRVKIIEAAVERVVEMLKRVKGSCRSSGIYMLIKKLCAMNLFDEAVFVMEETARKTSYYNILIAAKCRIGSFQEARELFDEMRRFGCDPNTKSYNYLLGSLCKKGRIAEVCELLEAMEKLGYHPDSVTFEIVIVHSCRIGSMDFAIEFLYHMMSEGLQPRITTHAAFIKGYFWSGRVGDAYKYVVEMSSKDKYSTTMNYSLLAGLFHKSGRMVEAQNVLIEMIEKGLKPNFPVYMKVMKGLFKLGKGDLVADLKAKFSKFS